MNRMTLSRGKIVALGTALALALLALAPGTWAPALAQTAGAPTPTPDPVVIPPQTFTMQGGASVFEAGPSVTLSVPGGAFQAGTTVEIASVVVPENLRDRDVLEGDLAVRGITSLPPAAEEGGFVLSVFNLTAQDGGSEVSPNEPVTMSFELTPEQLAAAGGDPNNAGLQFWDAQATPPAWVQVECTGSGTTVTCTLPHFSTWALTLQAPTAGGDDQGAPVTPAPADTGTGLVGTEGGSNAPTVGLLLGLAAVLAAAGGLGARFAVKRARVE